MADADHIITACARSFGIEREVLLSQVRRRRIARARQAAYWFLREFSTPFGRKRSYTQIAGVMGRDHSSVIDGKKLADYLLEHDAEFLAKIADAGEVLSRAGMPEQ